jgi:hypothetical protein
MFSAISLQVGSGVWPVLMVTVCGVAVFILVVLWRIMPLIHKPRVILRDYSKPPADLQSRTGAMPSVYPASTSAATVFASSVQPTVDPTELLQARSHWERLVEEAESNDQLTAEQRETFVEEGRRRIAEINSQLGETG